VSHCNLWQVDLRGQGVVDFIWALSVFGENFFVYECIGGMCYNCVSLKATNSVFDSSLGVKMFCVSNQWDRRTKMGRGEVAVTFISCLLSIFLLEEDDSPFA